MSFELLAASTELFGNALLVVALVAVGTHPWPFHALRRLASVAAVYAATNCFYATAYVGRTTGTWEIFDTPVQQGVYHIQIFSMWAMLIFGIESVAAARE